LPSGDAMASVGHQWCWLGGRQGRVAPPGGPGATMAPLSIQHPTRKAASHKADNTGRVGILLEGTESPRACRLGYPPHGPFPCLPHDESARPPLSLSTLPTSQIQHLLVGCVSSISQLCETFFSAALPNQRCPTTRGCRCAGGGIRVGSAAQTAEAREFVHGVSCWGFWGWDGMRI
jgi:hypothetical protein